MSTHFVFMSYFAEIPWVGRVARELRSRGIQSELWIVDPTERAVAEAQQAFDRIVDLRGGFRRTGEGVPAQLDIEALRAARQLEDELGLGPFLHREAGVDRVLTGTNWLELPPLGLAHRWTWEEVCRLSVAMASTVRERLRSGRPLAVVGEASMFSARLVARVTEAEGVPFLSPMNVPYLPGRIQFGDGLEGQWDECVDAFRALAGEPVPEEAARHARETLASIRTGSTLTIPRESVADYLSSPQARFSPRRVTNLAADWKAARTPDAISSPHNTYPDLLKPAARLARKARRRLLRDAFDREAGSDLPDVPFAAYFIHAQPEMTVEGWAHEFQDQVAVIRNIAASLPADLPLVVKEHRIQAGWRDPSFYKELHSVPGVIVVSDAIPSSQVVRRAEMVLTLTGTISLEAMCLGVPAVLFGSVYYERFPGVQRATSYEHLRELVAARADFVPATDEECLRALAARYVASREGGWMSGGRWEADERVTVQTLIDEAAARAIAQPA
ncbi:MAG: hypothetical protein QOI64_1386 [Solirubrobacteraceae bacterium]|jgi:hypothetical protein|nr:hypothetical protein [Solirubrobacteraceae bacterium]